MQFLVLLARQPEESAVTYRESCNPKKERKKCILSSCPGCDQELQSAQVNEPHNIWFFPLKTESASGYK